MKSNIPCDPGPAPLMKLAQATGLSGGVYYWRVRAVNESEVGDWSARREFTVPTPSPLEFKLYLPLVVRDYR